MNGLKIVLTTLFIIWNQVSVAQWQYSTSVEFEGEILEIRVHHVGLGKTITCLTEIGGSHQIETAFVSANNEITKYDNLSIGKKSLSDSILLHEEKSAFFPRNFEMGSLMGSWPVLYIAHGKGSETDVSRYYGMDKYLEKKIIGKKWDYHGALNCESNRFDKQTVNWTSGLSAVYYKEQVELHLIEEDDHFFPSIKKTIKHKKFPNNIQGKLFTSIQSDKFTGLSTKGKTTTIVCVVDTILNTLRTIACADDCIELKPLKLMLDESASFPRNWKPVNIKLHDWNNICLEMVEENGDLHIFRLVNQGLMDQANDNPQLIDLTKAQWTKNASKLNIINPFYTFSPIPNSKDAMLVRINGGETRLPFFSILTELNSGDKYSYEWIGDEGEIMPITHKEVSKVALSNVVDSHQQTKLVTLACVPKDNPRKVLLYKCNGYTNNMNLNNLLQKRQVLLDAPIISSMSLMYVWAKEIAQISESIGDYMTAVTYYETCLKSLDAQSQKNEYAYINAHLITCRFLMASVKDVKSDMIVDDSNPNTNSPTPSSQASFGISTDQLVQESQKSRALLKNLAGKVQEHPSLKNNIEGMKKVNIALALINQWQDEIVPREGFEFIDEQLGVLTNLISLIQGNQLNIQMHGNKLSFSDSGLNILLDNVEAMNQLKTLEGRDFTDEELSAVSYKEVKITEEISFNTVGSYMNYSGHYVCEEQIVNGNPDLCLPWVSDPVKGKQHYPVDCEFHLRGQPNQYGGCYFYYKSCPLKVSVIDNNFVFQAITETKIERCSGAGGAHIQAGVFKNISRGECKIINQKGTFQYTTESYPSVSGSAPYRGTDINVQLLPNNKIKISSKSPGIGFVERVYKKM